MTMLKKISYYYFLLILFALPFVVRLIHIPYQLERHGSSHPIVNGIVALVGGGIGKNHPSARNGIGTIAQDVLPNAV